MTRLKTWISVPEASGFPLENLPFGIIRNAYLPPRAATRIGDTLIDLAFLSESGYFSGIHPDLNAAFHSKVLNDFIALGRPVWRAVRTRLQELFEENNEGLRDKVVFRNQALFSLGEADLLMPLNVGDYTDFYSSREHAVNVGMMFRDPANALLPNWKHLPVGYHGRSSSIVVSGTNIRRPSGQIKPADGPPVFSPSKKLDFEFETAFVVGKQNPLGEPVPMAEAEEYLFGIVLFNDLSARDIQQWEYVPLGPFLSKNFGSVISPWVVTLDALEPFRVAGPEQDVPVLPYLQFEGKKNFDIALEAWIRPEGSEAKRVCLTNHRYLYWNMCQQLVHHTVGGCNLRVGDLCASGTISGPERDAYGSLLELTWNGKEPILYSDGKERTFLEDGDLITFRGYAEKDGLRISLGEVTTQILPAK